MVELLIDPAFWVALFSVLAFAGYKIVIFILLMMFSVALYRNWWEGKIEPAPVSLRRRKR